MPLVGQARLLCVIGLLLCVAASAKSDAGTSAIPYDPAPAVPESSSGVTEKPSDNRYLHLTPEVAAHVRRIRAGNPARRDDVFAKMGGSSVASHAFLNCFATEYVDFGDNPNLQATVMYFNTEPLGSFDRTSLAAGVNWNLRYANFGRPAYFRQEVSKTHARWALVLFGSNDSQNRNERVFAKRLVRLVEDLADMGVVPIMGSSIPRRSKEADRWIRRFNLIAQSVAEHWQLPYIDYYAAMRPLPRRGLARDGVHPNVLGKGGLRMACQFTDKGLRSGHNVRNLLTVQMLDEVLATIRADEEPQIEEGGTEAALGVVGPMPAELTPADFPFSTRIDKTALALADPEAESPIPGCGQLRAGSRTFQKRLRIDERTRLRVAALDLDGYKPRMFWVEVRDEGSRCRRRRTQTLEVAAKPGLWDLVVEVPERAARQGELLVLIDRNR